MKITHIITGLDRGGAEAVLTRLVSHDDRNTHEVIVLKDKGIYEEELISSGIKVYSLGMTHSSISIYSVITLYGYLRKRKPDIVQTWMFHADLIGGIVAKLARIKKIFWGIRAANIELLSARTKFVVRLSSLLSYIIPTNIICCGIQAKQVMSNNLYSQNKLFVIQNGYDTDVFTPFGAVINRNELSAEIKQNDFIIGFVSRWDIYKDIPNLLSALKVVVDSGIKVKCLFVGEGLDRKNSELYELIDSEELSRDIVLVGPRNDIPDFMRTIDICVLSSVSEAFPNVLAESMACGTPCVTTDAGDARIIVEKTGWVVPHSNHMALAEAIISAVSEMKDEQLWDQRKKICRDRIVNNFSLDKMVDNYVDMWSG